MKAAIYCRVSTDNQEREGTSPQTQLEACLKHCETKGYAVALQASETFSGLALERPKLSEVREHIRAGDVDVLVVYCLDRLSRDPVHGVILSEELEKHGVVLESVTETVESSEVGRLITYIRGFASKLEAEKIRERTMRGKAERLKEGRLPQGTGIGLYGYSWDKESGRRHLLAHETEVVRRMFQMAIDGKSTNAIAVSLNQSGVRAKGKGVWYPLTVRRILNNRAYTGVTYFRQTKRVSKSKVIAQPEENWVSLPDVTPQIISVEMFEDAQQTIAKAKANRPLKANASYLLTGFIKCDKCGSPVGGTTLQGKYRYYQCRGARPTATRGKVCDARYIKADEVEEWVWRRVETFAKHPLTWVKLFLNRSQGETRRIDLIS